MTITNKSIGSETVWTEDGIEYRELIRQEYTNCSFSAGEISGHPIDTLYLKLERDGVTDALILLRPDEAAAIAWVLTGVLWSDALKAVDDTEPITTHQDS